MPTTRRPRPGSASPSPGGCRTSGASSRTRPARNLPFDRRAGKPALLDARTFPSDADATVLEANDLAILLRSDQRAHIDDALDRLRASGLLRLTSLRRGFAGGALRRRQVAAARRWRCAADVPGADLIPEGAELFLGFTSTQKAAFGPGKIANFETLGYVDLRGSGYFREGTHMHLSPRRRGSRGVVHQLRLRRAGHDRVPARTSTSPRARRSSRRGPEQAQTARDVRRQFHSTGRIGHSASIQTTSRLATDVARRRRHALPEGHRRSRSAPTSTRSTTRSSSRTRPDVIQPGPMAGHPLPRLQPLERRLRPQPARDGRRAPGRRPLPEARAAGPRASTRS